jgi:hypothetical protein
MEDTIMAAKDQENAEKTLEQLSGNKEGKG